MRRCRDAGDAFAFEDKLRHRPVAREGNAGLFAPAVEIPVHADHCAFAVNHEAWPVVAEPAIIDGSGLNFDPRPAKIAGEWHVRLIGQHDDRFEAGNRCGHTRRRLARLRKPATVARAIARPRHPAAPVRMPFTRHVESLFLQSRHRPASSVHARVGGAGM